MKTKITALLITVVALTVGCTTDAQTIINESNAEVVTVTAEDGRAFQCLVVTRGTGTGRTMGIDCKWPVEEN